MGLYSLLQSPLKVTSPMLRLAKSFFQLFVVLVLDHQNLVQVEGLQSWLGPRCRVWKHLLYIFLAIENEPQQSAQQFLDLFIWQGFCDASLNILRAVMGEGFGESIAEA